MRADKGQTGYRARAAGYLDVTGFAIRADAVATLPHIAFNHTKDRGKQVIDPTPTLIANPWAGWHTKRVNSD